MSQSVGPFLVKQTVPGDPDPDPSTAYANERLTAITGIPDPVPPGRALTMTLPRYVNIREHDKMILHWADKQIVKIIIADEASNPDTPLAVIVPASIIDSTPGVGLIVRYDIYDTVMNWSLYSEARSYSLRSSSESASQRVAELWLRSCLRFVASQTRNPVAATDQRETGLSRYAQSQLADGEMNQAAGYHNQQHPFRALKNRFREGLGAWRQHRFDGELVSGVVGASPLKT